MKKISLISILTSLILSGCAVNAMKDLGDGNYRTVVRDSSVPVAKSKAMTNARNTCASQSKLPVYLAEDSPYDNVGGAYDITFTCKDEATLRAEEQKAEEAERKRKIDLAKEYPYTAVLACEFQGRAISNIAVCFADESNGTELTLRNGNNLRVYKFYEIGSLANQESDGMHIPLRKSFEIKAQNASENYILTLTLINTSTGAQLNKQAAGMWKIVNMRN